MLRRAPEVRRVREPPPRGTRGLGEAAAPGVNSGVRDARGAVSSAGRARPPGSLSPTRLLVELVGWEAGWEPAVSVGDSAPSLDRRGAGSGRAPTCWKHRPCAAGARGPEGSEGPEQKGSLRFTDRPGALPFEGPHHGLQAPDWDFSDMQCLAVQSGTPLDRQIRKNDN